MQTGFTKSYRSKWDNPIFRNLLEAGIWSWMCDTAVWQETKVRFNGELITLQRGQLATSIRFIAKGFCISEQAVRTFFNHITTDGMINTQVTHRATIITICNYDKYQQNKNQTNTLINTPLTQHQHTTNTNKKEYKKERSKEDKEINYPDFLPVDLFNDFLDMRKKIKKPATDNAIKILLGKLEKFNQQGLDITAIIQNSLVNNWQDFFAPKEQEKKKGYNIWKN